MALDVAGDQLMRDRRVVVEEPVLLAQRRCRQPVRAELDVMHGLQQEDRKVDRDQRVRDHGRAATGLRSWIGMTIGSSCPRIMPAKSRPQDDADGGQARNDKQDGAPAPLVVN